MYLYYRRHRRRRCCCCCCCYLVQPPVSHPPAGILPFLDVESIKDTGFRLARLTREDCSFMGPDCVIAKVGRKRPQMRRANRACTRSMAQKAVRQTTQRQTGRVHT